LIRLRRKSFRFRICRMFRRLRLWLRISETARAVIPPGQSSWDWPPAI
jgi:hypothetical protein